MSHPTSDAPAERSRGAEHRNDGWGPVARDLAAGLVLAGVVEGATWWAIGAPASHLLLAAAIYAALAVLLSTTAPSDLPGTGIGPANRVTLARAVVALPVFSVAPWPGGVDATGAWVVIVISTVVMVLDGVDGYVARRTDSRTRYGARFDMELDAALIMALSLLVWTSGRAGPWVLLIGLMRYLFVAAGAVWPTLRAELPDSLRRKVVCVVQGIVLLVALGPIIPDPIATAALAAGLAALVWSFSLDVVWAIRHGTGT